MYQRMMSPHFGLPTSPTPVCIFDFANVVRVGEVFHYFCTYAISFHFLSYIRTGIILKLRDRAAVDDRIPQRTHGAQTVDDLREHLDDVIGRRSRRSRR